MKKLMTMLATAGIVLPTGLALSGCTSSPDTPELDRLTEASDVIVVATVNAIEGLGTQNQDTGKKEIQYLYLVEVSEVLSGSGPASGDRFEIQALHSVEDEVVSTDRLKRGHEAIWFIDDTGTVVGEGYSLADPEGAIEIQTDTGEFESGDTALHQELEKLGGSEEIIAAVRGAGESG
ncbi:hypothetical protein [Citricoccus sp. GCM10030269]|uniref:hypothetical protein n=1 Tax=Citricoccus sp. GCM10030269 TaxID=3273388 RepID=UPI003611E181